MSFLVTHILCIFILAEIEITNYYTLAPFDTISVLLDSVGVRGHFTRDVYS